MDQIGLLIRDFVLECAALLKDASVPGFVVLALGVMLVVSLAPLVRDMAGRARALGALSRKVGEIDRQSFAEGGYEEVSAWVHDGLKGRSHHVESLREAWEEFGETLFIDDRHGAPVRRNTVRPAEFFNLEDLGYGPGFYRILPGVFVSLGLALTFLGLIGALQEMSAGGEINTDVMLALLGIASAKFIMSLTGLACTILFTIALRVLVSWVDRRLHALVRNLERRLDFVSLESLALEQLKVQREALEASRALAMEIAAELDRPLRKDLPQAISASINDNMRPILDQISRQGTASMSAMADDLSRQVTEGMGGALNDASARMAEAGERIAQLADRMDGSSGRMGAEMESAVARVAEAVDALRGAMSDTARETGGAFAQGAEQLLAAMNTTLEGIRDNTGESARAMSAAADEMTRAARTMKEEMEGAARAGSEAARGRMEATGAEVGEAISQAGASLAGTYEAAAGRIAELSRSLSERTGQDLLAPLKEIEGQLRGMVTTLEDGSRRMQGFASAVGEGAQAGAAAADSFRNASGELVAAATPIRGAGERFEGAARSLEASVASAATTVTRSSAEVAKSAERTLETASAVLGDEQRSIASVVASIESLVGAMKGQGDRIDDIDQKLGHAFDVYASSTERSMQSIRSSVTEMTEELNGALGALRAIVDSLQDFEPQQRRAS